MLISMLTSLVVSVIDFLNVDPKFRFKFEVFAAHIQWVPFSDIWMIISKRKIRQLKGLSTKILGLSPFFGSGLLIGVYLAQNIYTKIDYFQDGH